MLPGLMLFTWPRLLTSATASSLVRKSQKLVMSCTLPSVNWALTRICWCSLAFLVEDHVFGAEDDLGDGAAAGFALAAFFHPVAQDVVLPGAFAEAHAAAVLDGADRFEQEQAIIRIAEVDAPALTVARDRDEILFGFVAEQRQTEAAFALKRAVARAAVAARATQDAHDVPLEIDIFQASSVRQIDGGASGVSGEQQNRWHERQQESELGSGAHSSFLREAGPRQLTSWEGGGFKTVRQVLPFAYGEINSERKRSQVNYGESRGKLPGQFRPKFPNL